MFKRLYFIIFILFISTTLNADNKNALFSNKVENLYAGVGAKFMTIGWQKVSFLEGSLGYSFNSSNSVYLSKAVIAMPSATLFGTPLVPANYTMLYDGIGYQYTFPTALFIDFGFATEFGGGLMANSTQYSHYLLVRPSLQIILHLFENMRLNLGYGYQFAYPFGFQNIAINPLINPINCYFRLETALF